MGVTGLPPNALSSIVSHIQSQHNGKLVGPWRVQFRSFRTVRGAHSGQTGVDLNDTAHSSQTARHIMWEMTDSGSPDTVFLLFEDSALPTRAEMIASGTDSRSRWSCHVVDSAFHTLLRRANLPGPLGSPVGVTGPGSWVSRGAGIRFDGFTLRVRLTNRQSQTQDMSGAMSEYDECLISIGNIIVGVDRIAGGVAEIQYLPLARLSPESTLLGSLLVSLLPPHIVPLISPVHIPNEIPKLNAPRAMLSEAQLREIVPASADEWRSPKTEPDPSGAPPWEDTPSDAQYDRLGWTGVEVRRRMVFVYLSLLRAEGLA
ncbi:hypothetical protein MCUN1_000494 [Malassezia cuniculi]|uniref:Mediator complex subunit 20 n=1 Tax=Malassezia cuniculi TaxID=948313 RepID=A0AAF0ENM5_9BASI|nr:hypothetical protein MCUN1_000494 [Malassezia cuniculi]